MSGKQKLIRFEKLKNFQNVFERGVETFREDNFELKGKWQQGYFRNENPICLELACGKGEFTVNLAKNFPNTNYVGVDIKGSRMFVGAEEALNSSLNNAAFLRTRIDFITAFFGQAEVDEIWLVHPDPHLKGRRERKRLTSFRFIDRYREILKPGGIIRLKTDSIELFQYTIEECKTRGYSLEEAVENVYNQLGELDDKTSYAVQIKTHYEKLFEQKGHKIHYLSFKIH
jgi:tRNA (guanine-N7-)-methyltransferase